MGAPEVFDEHCNECKKPLIEEENGGEWFYIWEDVNDLTPQHAICSSCLDKQIRNEGFNL